MKQSYSTALRGEHVGQIAVLLNEIAFILLLYFTSFCLVDSNLLDISVVQVAASV